MFKGRTLPIRRFAIYYLFNAYCPTCGTFTSHQTGKVAEVIGLADMVEKVERGDNMFGSLTTCSYCKTDAQIISATRTIFAQRVVEPGPRYGLADTSQIYNTLLSCDKEKLHSADLQDSLNLVSFVGRAYGLYRLAIDPDLAPNHGVTFDTLLVAMEWGAGDPKWDYDMLPVWFNEADCLLANDMV